MTPSRQALIGYLTHAAQALHAEDQRLREALTTLKVTQQLTPELFELLLDSQRTALRTHANAILMMSGYLEEPQGATKRSIWRRVREALKDS